MDPEISNKLLSFQVAHVLQLFECFKKENVVLDASDTGTGKTYCTIALCKMLNLNPFIICPKSVINTWLEVCTLFGVKIFGIANYEMLKGSKYYTEDLEAVLCPYLDKVYVDKKADFEFQLPNNVLVIFDEAHRCKNYKTITSRLLLSIKKTNRKMILLSATITDKIELFKSFGVVFGLYSKLTDYNTWMRKQLIINKVILDKKNLDDAQKNLYIINKTLFPAFGSRMKIKELGNLFPENNVMANAYYLTNHAEVDKLYNEINLALLELKDKETRAEALGKIVRARQRIELLKVPIFEDLAKEALDNGYSIAIFVNYRETMDHLCNLLNTACVINGDQTLEERQANIKEFQENKSNIIIATIQSGGVGISLHDLYGVPRMSLISPSWSAIDIKQALGRIHRAGSKTKCIQKIVYCAKTYEEKICNIIKTKLRNLSGINDGDLVGPSIPVETIDKINDKIKDESLDYKTGGKPGDVIIKLK